MSNYMYFYTDENHTTFDMSQLRYLLLQSSSCASIIARRWSLVKAGANMNLVAFHKDDGSRDI